MESLIALILVPLVVAAAAMLDGFVIHLMWSWYMVPLGVPAIGIAHAIGIDLLVSLTAHQTIPVKDGDKEFAQKQLIRMFTRPVIILLVAWIARHWMAP
jgi:hypothetical protein